MDLEKAFDRVPREVIAWALRKKGIPEGMVQAVMALYVDSKSKVRTVAGTSEEFGVGVHHISTILKSLHWLKINKRIQYKVISVTHMCLVRYYSS